MNGLPTNPLGKPSEALAAANRSVAFPNPAACCTRPPRLWQLERRSWHLSVYLFIYSSIYLSITDPPGISRAPSEEFRRPEIAGVRLSLRSNSVGARLPLPFGTGRPWGNHAWRCGRRAFLGVNAFPKSFRCCSDFLRAKTGKFEGQI